MVALSIVCPFHPSEFSIVTIWRCLSVQIIMSVEMHPRVTTDQCASSANHVNAYAASGFPSKVHILHKFPHAFLYYPEISDMLCLRLSDTFLRSSSWIGFLAFSIVSKTGSRAGVSDSADELGSRVCVGTITFRIFANASWVLGKRADWLTQVRLASEDEMQRLC